MTKIKGPEIVIIITVILALSNFFLYDHSGINIGDVSLDDYDENVPYYNLTYYLRVGHTFNYLYCEHLLYDSNGLLIANNTSFLEHVYSGSHTVSSNISLNNYSNSSKNSSLPEIKRININVYDKKVNSTLSNDSKVYNTTVYL